MRSNCNVYIGLYPCTRRTVDPHRHTIQAITTHTQSHSPIQLPTQSYTQPRCLRAPPIYHYIEVLLQKPADTYIISDAKLARTSKCIDYWHVTLNNKPPPPSRYYTPPIYALCNIVQGKYRYMRDLQSLNTARPQKQPILPHSAALITIPLNLET